MKIIIVEDDKTVGQYVQHGLEEQHYHADLVDDGLEGLRLISGGKYDLAVLDLRLPGMNGVEMVRTLRDRGVGIPILVLTAQDALESKVAALRAGADDYVTKPFAFEELLARVEALARRPRQVATPRPSRGRPRGRHQHPRSEAERPADRAHAQGVRRARVPGSPSGPGDVAAR
jgi:two-component system copper resistance phosphate regulon response regulator CusR